MPAKAPSAFDQAALVGQPFTIANPSIPVTCQFTCNCQLPGELMVIDKSAPVTCSRCRRIYAVAFNPVNGQLMIGMSEPGTEVPS